MELEVKLFFSKSKIEIYYKYELIATHQRIKSPGNYSTDPAHMATHNKYIAEWNPERFLATAASIHSDVELYIRQVLLKKTPPEQGYKSCQGIISFAKRVGNDRLLRACQRAHQYGIYNFKIIESILQRNLDQYDIESELPPMPKHDNIRGEDYYQ